MTAEAAVFQFFDNIIDSVPAYPNISVPDDAKYPYITYPVITGNWTDQAYMSVYIWTKGESVAALTAKVRAIGDALKDGGKGLLCDGGWVWLTTGNPFVNYMVDAEDNTIRYAILNINAEFLNS